MSRQENTAVQEATAQLVTLNDHILQAEEAGFADQLAFYLHDDFTIIRASGKKEDRQAFLNAVPTNAHRGRIAETSEVQLYADCAVVVLRIRTSHNPDGTAAPRSFWNTRVFVQHVSE